MINVLIVEPYKLPYEKEIPNTLEAKQKIVGGYIETTCILDDEDVVLICNEEGKMNGMKPNRDIGYDIIFGPFIITGEVDEEGNFTSLNKEQIEKYKKRFDKKSIIEMEDKLLAIMFGKKRKEIINDYEGGMI